MVETILPEATTHEARERSSVHYTEGTAD